MTRGDADRSEDEDGVTVHRRVPRRPELPTDLGGAATLRFGASVARDEWRYRGAIARTLEDLVRDDGVDLIEAADHMAEPIRFRPGRHSHVPFVVRLHTPLAVTELAEPTIPEAVRLAIRAVERRFILSATHVTAPGAASARAFRREMRLGNRPITVYPNPPTFAGHAPASREATPPIVLFVGRLRRAKGADLLVRAMPRVLQRVPEARFVFVGDDHAAVPGYGSTAEYLRALLPEELGSRLEIVGHVPHHRLGEYYREAAVCVFPSVFEAFGYTCLEAMAHGKAIVASDAGGMRDLLDGGAAGVPYTPPDVGALARHVTELLLDPGRRRDLGDRARRRAQERYDPDRVTSEIEAFYRRAIDEVAG